jgi:hypothetical protein
MKKKTEVVRKPIICEGLDKRSFKEGKMVDLVKFS